MEFLFIDHRHPLFSVVMLLLVIAVVALANHWWGLLRRRDQDKKLSRFLSRFESGRVAKDYKSVLSIQPDSTDSLMLLASIYYKSGEYTEAIKIYLALLEILADKTVRVDVMVLLGRTYHKAGFMKRSRDILLDALRIKARNSDALELLLVIYEQMREFNSALEVLDALEELGRDMHHERAFLQAGAIVSSAALSDEHKRQKLLALWQVAPFLSRQVLEFFFRTHVGEAWRQVSNDCARSAMDLFWQMPKDRFNETEALKHPFLKELYTAKGWVDCASDSEIFEFSVLIALGEKRQMADLEFEYLCGACMAEFPLYFHRCPSCSGVGTARVEPVLSSSIKDGHEASAAFY